MDLTLTKEQIRQEAGTPKWLFAQLHKEYKFTIDVCASRENAKLKRFWGKKQDGLFWPWHKETVWCNPPYDDIPRWLIHGYDALSAVYLLPVRADRLWWMRYKTIVECHYFIGEKPHRRIQFEPPKGVKYSSNPGSNCLFCFGKGFTPGRERWRSGRTGELL